MNNANSGTANEPRRTGYNRINTNRPEQPARDIGEKFNDLLNRLGGVRQTGEEYRAFCPCCESGKTGGDRHLYLRVAGDRILVDCKKGCSVDAVCAAVGKATADLFEGAEKKQPWELLREHIYYEAGGGPVAKKVMYRKPGGDKTAVWHRYENGGYIKGLREYKPPMYNLPMLAKAEGPIFIVEGEKDADTLCSMGMTATTAPNGAAQAKIPEEDKKYFKDREVVIMGDNDDPGRKYAEMLYNALRKTGSKVVKIDPAALWDGLPEKGDITDIVRALGEAETKALLEKAIRSAPDADLYRRPYIGRREKTDRQGNVTVSYFVITQELYKYIRGHSHYLFVRGGAKESVQRYIYREGVYRLVSEEEFKGFIRDFTPYRLFISREINEVFKILEMDGDRFVPGAKLDSDSNIMNFQNGLLNLHTMELMPHTPDVLSTIQIPCNYDPAARRPPDSVFDMFLDHLTEGQSDKKELILQFMGVALSNVPGHLMKQSLFMIGEGDTGKSHCKELLIRLLGDDKFSGIDLAELEKSPFNVSELFGKRLAGSSDMGFMTVKELLKFKQLVGGDTISAEFKYESRFRFKFTGVFWFCANNFPKFGGDRGDWVYKRIVIIECNNPVSEKDKDRMLLDKMDAEREYVVKLCVDALRRVIENGYTYDVPASSLESMNRYKIENDSVLRFLEECTVPRPEGKILDSCTTAVTYKVYCAWCRHNNNGHTECKKEFRSIIDKAGRGKIIKTNGGYTFYESFTLSLETKREYVNIYGFDKIENETV